MPIPRKSGNWNERANRFALFVSLRMLKYEAIPARTIERASRIYYVVIPIMLLHDRLYQFVRLRYLKKEHFATTLSKTSLRKKTYYIIV